MKNIIKTSIIKLRNLCNFFEETYKEAYDEDLYEIKESNEKSLEQEFKEQVIKRQEENKKEAIDAISTIAAFRFFKNTGFFMTKEEANKFAERFFNHELEKGNLDELYKPKEI